MNQEKYSRIVMAAECRIIERSLYKIDKPIILDRGNNIWQILFECIDSNNLLFSVDVFEKDGVLFSNLGSLYYNSGVK